MASLLQWCIRLLASCMIAAPPSIVAQKPILPPNIVNRDAFLNSDAFMVHKAEPKVVRPPVNLQRVVPKIVCPPKMVPV